MVLEDPSKLTRMTLGTIRQSETVCSVFCFVFKTREKARSRTLRKREVPGRKGSCYRHDLSQDQDSVWINLVEGATVVKQLRARTAEEDPSLCFLLDATVAKLNFHGDATESSTFSLLRDYNC